MAKRYFLKFNVVSEEIILDASSETFSVDEILLSESTVSLAQGRLLREAIKKYESPYSTEVQHEFDKLFVVCLGCGLLMTRNKMKKAQGDRCLSCWKQNVEDKKVVYFKNVNKQRDYERRVRKLKLHLSTNQGLCDKIPIEIIHSNFKIAMQGKSMKDLAEHIGVSTKVIYNMFNNKNVRYEKILQITEWLKIPLSKLLEIPYGVTISRTDGVPTHLLRRTVRYLDERIDRHL